MVTLLDLLKKVAQKSGIKVDDEKVKAFFGNEDLNKIEIPEDVFKPIESQLISIAEAKNNHQDIKNHYTATALAGVDSTIDEAVTEFGLTDDDKNQLKVERSSFKRIKILGELIRKAEQAKALADKPNQKAIQDQINALNDQVKAEKAAKQALVDEYTGKEKTMELRYAMDNLLLPHKTIHDNLAFKTKQMILQTLIQEDLRTKNLKFDFDDNHNLVLMRQDGTNYHENNEQVNAQQYVDKVLANNKQLATPAAPIIPPGPGGNPGNNGGAPAGGNGGAGKTSPMMKELLEKSIAGVNQQIPGMVASN